MSDIGGGGPVAVGRLILDAAGVTQGADQAVSSIGRIGGVSGSTYFGLRNLGLGFEALGAAASGSLLLATDQAVSWEAAMARIQVSTEDAAGVAGRATGNFAEIERGLRGIAENAPFTISGIEGVAQQLAAAGLSGQTLVGTTREVLQLNQLTGVSTDQLAGYLSKVALAFGFSAQDSKGYASALLAITQNTPANISELITLSQRTVAAAAGAHISAEANLALNASLASLPQLARSAGTAMATLITDFANATTNGKQLKVIADVSGETVEKIRSDWATKPEQAIATFIEHLGVLKGGLQEQETVLDSLGIKSQNVQRTIIGLADAQQNEAGSAAEVSNSIRLVDDAFAKAELSQQEMSRITDTTSAQMQILHNNVDLAAQSFGSVLLPVLNPAIRFLSDFARGLASLPAWVRILVESVLGLTAVFGILIGGMLILLPRVIQAAAGFGQLRTMLRGTAVDMNELEVAEGLTVAGLQELIDSLIEAGIEAGLANDEIEQLIASQLEAAGIAPELAAETAATAVSFGAEAAAADVAAVSTEGLAISMQSLIPVVGVVLAVISVATLAWQGHQKSVGDAADTNKGYASDESLVAAMQREASGVAFATDQWILHKLAVEGTLSTLANLNVPSNITVGFVKGTASPEEITQLKQALQSLPADQAAAAAKALIDLNGTAVASASAANALASADSQLGESQADVAQTGSDAADAMAKQQKAASALQSAITDLAGAEASVEQSAIDVANAEDAFAKAEEDVANKAELEQQALDALTAASDDLVVAQDRLRNSETDLGNARAKAQEDVEKATLALWNSQLAEQRAAERVKEAQAAVTAAQNADKTKELVKDTNALHDAQLRLVDAELGVSDAQWQLNYLQEEGASARDILDAQNNLTGAQNAAADAKQAAADAQDTLNKAQAADPNAALIKAQEDLAQATLDYDASVLKVKDDGDALKRAQDDAANDVAYHQAVDDVANAQLGVDQAQQKVHSTTDALHAIQNGSIERNLEQATLRLRDSYVQQANAEANLQIDQDALNGRFDTAAQKAQILSDKLAAVGQTANPIVAGDINALAWQIGGAAGQLDGLTTSGGNVSNQLNGSTTPAVRSLKDQLQGVVDNANGVGAESGFMRFLEGIGSWIENNIGPFGEFVRDFLTLTGIIGGDAKENTDPGSKMFIPPAQSEGGYFDRPTVGLFGEDGPELILPLTKPDRMMKLLAGAGVMDMLNTRRFANAGVSIAATVGAGGGGDYHHHEGDQFHLTAVTEADPEEIINEYFWSRRTRPG